MSQYFDGDHENNRGRSRKVTKRCRLSWLTNSVLVYEPKCGGRGAVRGSQPSVIGAQINFGDLTPYLTYGKKEAKAFMIIY